MNRDFENNCLKALENKVAQGALSRRRFTQLAAVLLAGAPIALRGHRASAADNELVFVNCGGDASMAFTKAFGDDFKAKNGVLVKQDTSCGTEGAIEAQFSSGKPSWDVVDADPFSAEALGKKGLMEEIDYSIVDKNKMRPGYGWKYAASSYFYSYIIAYDASKFGDKIPVGMADFFDVEKFPGKRSLYKWGSGMWEAALLADGVAPDKLYPLDLDRAHKKIAAFRDNIVSFWGGGGEAASVLLNGEASMALIWSSRASVIESDSGGAIKFVWDQGLLQPGCMAVLKGNPGGKENAMKFIASAQDPQKQAVLFELLGMGPTNPEADALIPEDRRRFNPVDPANMAKQIPIDMAWYEQNYAAALDAYTRVIAA